VAGYGVKGWSRRESAFPASTNDEVDLRVGRQHPSGPAALGDDDALSAFARVGIADLAGAAMAPLDRQFGGSEPLADYSRDRAPRGRLQRGLRRDREALRDSGCGVVVRVARLGRGHRARTGAREVHRRSTDGAVAARCERNRQPRGRARADREVWIAVRLVRERAERDRLARPRYREALRDGGRGNVVPVARLRRRDRARTGARELHCRGADRAAPARREGDRQPRRRRPLTAKPGSP
jgi:hypothetical protein